MVRRAKGEKPRSDTRERILNVGEELIAQHGIEGFQLKDVAHRIGIRPPSIFAHFAGRDAVAQAIAERMLARITQIITVEAEDDPVEILRGWMRSLVVYLVENPAHLRIILRDMAHAGGPGMTDYENARQLVDQMYVRIGAVLKRGEEAGQFRPVRVEGVVAQMFGAIVSSLVWEGWDDAGHPIPGVPVSCVQSETEQLVLGFIARDA